MTVTSTVPDPGGTCAVIVFALFAVNVAAVVPKCTADAPERFVPETVTRLPAGPPKGSTLVTVGDGGGGTT